VVTVDINCDRSIQAAVGRHRQLPGGDGQRPKDNDRSRQNALTGDTDMPPRFRRPPGDTEYRPAFHQAMPCCPPGPAGDSGERCYMHSIPVSQPGVSSAWYHIEPGRTGLELYRSQWAGLVMRSLTARPIAVRTYIAGLMISTRKNCVYIYRRLARLVSLPYTNIPHEHLLRWG
jgi:hypothetical protein